MRIGLFGGTFDPFHIGHERLLTAAAKSGRFDRILVIPSANPPHKHHADLRMFSYRYEMTRLAISRIKADIPIAVSDCEIDSPGNSYTLNTVNQIIADYGQDVSLICGSDILFDIHHWHKPEELLKNAALVVLVRPGYLGESMRAKATELVHAFDARISFLEAGHIEASSSEIRAMIRGHQPDASHYLSAPVDRWIQKNDIYHPDYDMNILDLTTIEAIKHYERLLRANLTVDRLIHSINTMNECIRLARIHGADPNPCAIAGLVHDCAKYTDSEPCSDTNSDQKGIPGEIYHAYAGRETAIRDYGIHDEEILNAIYYHTTSRKNATNIEIITYVADKIEPARNFPDIERIRDIAKRDLRQSHYECLKDIVKMLKKKKKFPHPDTVDALMMYNNERWFIHEP